MVFLQDEKHFSATIEVNDVEEVQKLLLHYYEIIRHLHMDPSDT